MKGFRQFWNSAIAEDAAAVQRRAQTALSLAKGEKGLSKQHISAASRRSRARVGLHLMAIAVLSLAPPLDVCGQPVRTERVSVSSAGAQGNDLSGYSAISADGRFVAFESDASNLVSGDTNGRTDVFVRDRLLDTTERVSVSSIELQANSWSNRPCISEDGRFVAFDSYASNLVGGDTNGATDVFIRDRQLGTTARLSVSSSSEEGNGRSLQAVISADGRFVVFSSEASNLVAGDTNGVKDLFLRDRQLNTTERVSVSSSGEQGNDDSFRGSVSADGRFVAFYSAASNLVAGDTNSAHDVFVRDRHLGTTERVSVTYWGGQTSIHSSSPTISANGRFVAFSSYAPNLVRGDANHTVDAFVRDRLLATTQMVSLSSTGEQGNYGSENVSISADGRFVAFWSFASNLVDDDTNGDFDVFVRDRLLGKTQRVSVSSTGVQGNDASSYPAISADGRFVAFESEASNLVAGDTNDIQDVFVRQYGESRSWPTVTGKLEFRDWVAAVPSSAFFELREPGETEAFGSWHAALSSDGSFTIPAPFYVFDLSVKHSHWLRKTVLGLDTTSGNATTGTLRLRNGDANEDNVVSLPDLNRVLLQFAKKDDTMADLNGSGTVDVPDLNIVLIYFAAAGDP